MNNTPNRRLYLRGLNEDGEVELWKDITDYEGFYQVSSFGRVRSLDREVVRSRPGHTSHSILKRGKPKRPSDGGHGYLIVALSKDSISKTVRISRLVCAAFNPNPKNLPFVNHIDGVKTNNRYSNLEWVTMDENAAHAAENGLTRGKAVTVSNEDTNMDFLSIAAVSVYLKCAASSVSRCLKLGLRFKGYSFKFK